MVREMERPNSPQPAPRDNPSPADHVQTSRRFRAEPLPMYLDKGSRRQAAEKIWGSVAHAIIAIGKQRGWKVGKTPSVLEDVVVQLGAELDEANGILADAPRGDRKRFRLLLSVLNGIHDNDNGFLRKDLDIDDIEYAAGDAADLLARLEPLLDTPAQPFTPRPGQDQRRLSRLLDMPLKRNDSRDQENRERMAQLNRLFPPGKEDANGFSPNYGYQKPQTSDDDNGEAPLVASHPSDSPPPDGGQAKIVPKSGQGESTTVHIKVDKNLRPDTVAATPPHEDLRPRRAKGRGAQSSKVNIQFE